MKGADHVPLTRRQFVRKKRKQLRELMREFHDRKEDGDGIKVGAAYLPPAVQDKVRLAYVLLHEALKLLNEEKV